MHILLLNTNPVVSRLIALCIREDHVSLEEVTVLESTAREQYDILFVDDASYSHEVDSFLDAVKVGERVLLAGKSMTDVLPECFTAMLKKPFLPSQISEILKKAEAEESEEEGEDAHFIFPLSSTEEESEESDEERTPEENEVANEALTEVSEEEEESVLDIDDEVTSLPKVLDNSEIEKIKALLDESEEEVAEEREEEAEALDLETRKIEVITEHLEADGLEIVTEDDMLDLLTQVTDVESALNKISVEESPAKEEKRKKKEKKRAKKKEKEVKKKKKEKEESYSFEEALIAAIEGMKIKKIRKLLKDADISIQISFKDK